ncbi:MAG: 4-hydroxy-tetrahydrodipicolinate reductase [Candidatus Cloacimonetes bacterium]|nr:4-hydroxy-tetrahydrodipicolinate reductase [Candidatus Cloacimonadota bacterium]MCF7814311.1 4-hydroxy-tetrahydrodipicolinate reductase [Candidatus Cloacimonadota bacterium]MCF7868388.1 4-hydroxy-tetrahydrodipicolinate reductase [Candidatus Cloacimonadota bacterium]MCF7883847.1 4-hydroxy-tetrahydrodipicolinate reductase [Candidatus Cloacimonadota bacterium]
MKKLAIIGYGQMGRLIEKLAPEFDFEVCAKIDPILGNDLSDPKLIEADVCIEFTKPAVAHSNLTELVKQGQQVVCGTTGWYENLKELEKIVQENDTGFIYGSNFSFGMNLFYQIVRETCKLMNKAVDYDVFGLEYHHNKKQDSPSGTAKILSDIVIKNIDKKAKSQFEKLDRRIEKDEFHFASVRAGNIPGTHLIGFDSEADSIELKHTARNRNGLAIGALKAARWIIDKKGFYNFAETFQNILGD